VSSSQFAVFCDFDGTIASRDVGYHMYHHFTGGRNDELVPDWKSGVLSTRECMTIESSMVRATPDEFYAYLDSHELDRSFAWFAQRCRAADIPLMILSDGLDIYITYLLNKHGIPELPLISNRGYLADGRLRVEFPFPDPHSTGGGVCKGDRIAEYRAAGNVDRTVIFVGDGLSDVGAIPEVDILFAKKDLRQYCEQQNIPYNGFDTFEDVSRELTRRLIFAGSAD
jgi:2,3-diketo-5-methylthio-1-phosphopentane phosphatase